MILKTILLLLASNVFMTFAWYGHLKYKHKPIFLVIVVSWLIAFFEYCLQVPANRMGHGLLTAPQLKTLQEGMTFLVFTVFSLIYLKEKPSFYDHVSFLLIFLAVVISMFQPKA